VAKKSDSPAIKQATEEAREALENADMGLFDRYMKWLVNVPKEKIDAAQKQRAERGMPGSLEKKLKSRL
jgi:hypothetical protein